MTMLFAIILLASLLCACTPTPAARPTSQVATVPGWPGEVQAITYPSAADGTLQPALFYRPPTTEPVPLLVALHTWSNDYRYPQPAYARWCIAQGWVMIHPNFRGPNNRPEATGSELVVQDILSAVEYAKKNANIDPRRIYLAGVSGGGHLALLLAGRHPEIWAGVSAWCPLYDLAAWHAETKSKNLAYYKTVEQSCGGRPGLSPAVDEQYRLRSPVEWLTGATTCPLDINTGIADGHQGSVPISHALHAFNAVAAAQDRIAEGDIAAMAAQPQMPAQLLQRIEDPNYRRGQALFRQRCGNVRVTVFQGGHTMLYEAALAWLEQQRKGAAAVWDIPATRVDLTAATTDAGR